MAGGRRGRPSKYPVELRERAVRMVLEVRKDTGQTFGVVNRVAKELGMGGESLRKWVTQPVFDFPTIGSYDLQQCLRASGRTLPFTA